MKNLNAFLKLVLFNESIWTMEHRICKHRIIQNGVYFYKFYTGLNDIKANSNAISPYLDFVTYFSPYSQERLNLFYEIEIIAKIIDNNIVQIFVRFETKKDLEQCKIEYTFDVISSNDWQRVNHRVDEIVNQFQSKLRDYLSDRYLKKFDNYIGCRLLELI